MGDGAFDGGPRLAKGGVELDLVGVEVDAGESLVGHGVDALDADVVFWFSRVRDLHGQFGSDGRCTG